MLMIGVSPYYYAFYFGFLVSVVALSFFVWMAVTSRGEGAETTAIVSGKNNSKGEGGANKLEDPAMGRPPRKATTGSSQQQQQQVIPMMSARD